MSRAFAAKVPDHDDIRIRPRRKTVTPRRLPHPSVYRIVGLAALFVALTLYESYEQRQLLGRYSYAYAVLLVFVLAITVQACVTYVSHARRPAHDSVTAQPTLTLLNAAIGMLGLAYLAAALANPGNAGRILIPSLLASSTPVSAALEWLTLLVLLVASMPYLVRMRHRPSAPWLLSAWMVAALLVLGEGVARVKSFMAPAPMGIPTYSGDIWSHRYVRLNGLGFRDADHSPGPSAGSKRLLLIGDSFAFGAGIRRPEDRFGEQLATRLTALTDQSWEVVNMSRGDIHTLHEIEFLKRGLRYRPDLVVMLYVFNDVDYLVDDFGLERAASRNVIFEPTGLGRLHPLRLTYWNSYLAQEIYARARLLRYRFVPATGAADAYHTPLALERHLADLTRFTDMARDSVAAVVIVPLDPFTASEPTARERYTRFTTAAQSNGLPILSLVDAFPNERLADITVNALDRHPNERAYQLAAQLASERVMPFLSSAPTDSGSSPGTLSALP